MQDIGYSAKFSAQWKKLIFLNEISMKVPSTINQGRIPTVTGPGIKLPSFLAAPKLEIQSTHALKCRRC